MSKMKTLLITGTLVITAAVTVASGFAKNTVTIFTDEGYIEIKTNKTKIEDILQEANIILAENHKVFPKIGEELMTNYVTIKEGAVVSLKVDGEELHVLSWAETVQDFLKEQQVLLNGSDKVNIPLERTLKSGQEIHVVRVDKEIVTVEEPLTSFNYHYYDARLPLGTQRVYRQNVDGIKEITYKLTYEDGVEVARKKLEENIISQPVHGIVHQNSRELASRSSREYAVVGVASFYGDKFHGRRTANGEIYDKNAMTAAHRTLPFGTMVEVTYLRTGKSVVVRINDRGPFIEGRIIDLSEGAAREIGLRPYGIGDVRVKVIGTSR